MRFSRIALASCASAILLFAAAAGAQDKGGSSGSAADKAGAAAGGDKTGGDKASGDKASGDKASGDKDKASQPPQNVGGYSWSDKPAKGSKKNWRRPKIKIDPNAPIAMYPGFRVLADGTSQVWVYVSRKVTITAAATPGQPTFVLNGAQVAVRNNMNALVTSYFETPLSRVRLKRDSAGAQLVLELREPVAVKHRIVDGPGGTSILYVDLPKPTKHYGTDDFDMGSGNPSSRGQVLPSAGKKSPRGPSQ